MRLLSSELKINTEWYIPERIVTIAFNIEALQDGAIIFSEPEFALQVGRELLNLLKINNLNEDK